MRPAKIQISLYVHAVWSKSSMCIFWIPKDTKFLHADRKDSRETVQADLSLRWAHMSEGTFSHVAAYMPYKDIVIYTQQNNLMAT